MGEAANGYFTLNTGASIPCIGLGTWQSSPSVVADAIVAAIKAGYRHIDCARFYQNEKEIGVALKKVFNDGLVKRDDLFITSKLWCSDHAPEDVPRALELTLKDLQLEYIDLYLIHWPFRVKKGEDVVPDNFIPPDIPSTWRAMEKLQNSGKARAIGVSNFSTKKLDDLLATTCTIPAVNQVECHPAWQQVKLHSYCRSKGIHLSGYAPLTAPGRKWMYGNVLENPIVQMLAETLNKTPAQVVLRWGIQMGHSVLPKSCSEARIKENINIFNWSIPQHLIGKFGEVEQVRHVTGQFAVHEKSIYKTFEQLWDDDN